MIKLNIALIAAGYEITISFVDCEDFDVKSEELSVEH
jgi:hypothetical protein